jgi:HEAT repeat protein
MGGQELIEELLSNPKKFAKEGQAFQLLDEYFKGFDLQTLRPLLKSSDIYVISAALFVVSELGNKAWSLVDDIVPLLNIDNPYVQADALESVMTCSSGEKASLFGYVVRALENNNEGIRNLAMFLLSNANAEQLRVGSQIFKASDPNKSVHEEGLSVLLEGELATSEKILKMINDNDALVRKYGVIASKRLLKKFPTLIEDASSSSDSDVAKFAQEFATSSNH